MFSKHREFSIISIIFMKIRLKGGDLSTMKCSTCYAEMREAEKAGWPTAYGHSLKLDKILTLQHKKL